MRKYICMSFRFYFIFCVRQELSADYVEHECRDTAVLNSYRKSSLLCYSFVHILKSVVSISHGEVFDKLDIFPDM